MAPPKYVGALDQGTTSTRFILFDGASRIVSSAQVEHKQIMPREGLVEHDPLEIWRNAVAVITQALARAGAEARDLAAVGITNQRETTVVWDRQTGEPLSNAVVWMDMRSQPICDRVIKAVGGKSALQAKTGLPIVPYFSGTKLRWLIENDPKVATGVANGTALFGTIDSWLMFKLSGGTAHLTDVTNASRTLLMDLATLQWDAALCETIGVPMAMLPRIVSSSERLFEIREPRCLAGVPVAGVLGDQQAALFGQTCFTPGEAKNTYGTGCFMLLNTGEQKVESTHGLLTTVAYKIGDAKPVFALEGSVAIGGAIVQWLRDNLGLIKDAPEVETLARQVADNGDMYFVPAFSGLYAPYWRDDARGVMVGMTRFINKGHVARAALEAIAFQSRDVFGAMEKDSHVKLKALKVDGGAVQNGTLLQFQSDILGIPVVRPVVTETTALGAAYAAGLATGFWKDLNALKQNWAVDKTWMPAMTNERRNVLTSGWAKAIERTYGWVQHPGAAATGAKDLKTATPHQSDQQSHDGAAGAAALVLAGAAAGFLLATLLRR